MAGTLLALSVVVDAMREILPISHGYSQVLEEGFKFVDAAAWHYFCFRVAAFHLTAPTDPSVKALLRIRYSHQFSAATTFITGYAPITPNYQDTAFARRSTIFWEESMISLPHGGGTTMRLQISSKEVVRARFAR